MIKSFSIKNYRNLNFDKLNFKKINLLIGPNNSGKSNFVSALSFFPDLIVNETRQSFLDEIDQRGWDDLLRRDIQSSGVVDAKWEMDLGNGAEEFGYEMKFQVTRGSHYPKGIHMIHEEIRNYPIVADSIQYILCHDRKPGRGLIQFGAGTSSHFKQPLPIVVDPTNTVLRQREDLLASDKFRESAYPAYGALVKSIENYCEKYRRYSSSEFDRRSIREACKINAFETQLQFDGSNFVNVLGNLDDRYDFLERFENKLRLLMPDLNKLKIMLASDGKRQLQLNVDGKRFKISEMSDGTISAMLLTLLLWTPERMNVLLFDEPELNLHPAWLKIIASWILESTSADQYFISTHSPDFLDVFTDAFQKGEVGLFVSNLEDEQTIQSVSPEKLNVFFESGYELGDLYRVGELRLGGWPF